MDDATYKDVSGRATMTAKETAEVTTHLSNTGKTFQKNQRTFTQEVSKVAKLTYW